MVFESFMLLCVCVIEWIGLGGGIEGENIIVYCVLFCDIVVWIV